MYWYIIIIIVIILLLAILYINLPTDDDPEPEKEQFEDKKIDELVKGDITEARKVVKNDMKIFEALQKSKNQN